MLAMGGVPAPLPGSLVSVISSPPCPVEAGVHLLVVLVYAEELPEQFVVDRAVVRVRVVGGHEAGAVWDIVEAEAAQGDGGDEGGPAGVGQARLLQLPDGAVQDVGVDLAPEAGLGAAAHEVDV